MKKRSTYLLSVALVVSFYVIYSLLLVARDGDNTALVEHIPHMNAVDVSPSLKSPKITVIVIWVPRSDEVAVYVPYFFQSVEANPEVELLFVEVDKKGFGCKTYSSARNAQHLCLAEEEYYDLHVNFLCEKWECSTEMREMVLAKMLEEGDSDRVNSFFRVLRNGVFKSWINPATTIWGWCDVDEYWGNFASTFPWDVAHEFDVLVPANQPEPKDTKLVFTRGHMAFFRNTADVLDRFLSFHKFASYSNFVDSPKLHVDTEESEFSHYIFSEESAFTFLVFEAMDDSWDVSFVSPKGIFNSKVKKDLITKDSRQKLFRLVQGTQKTHVPTFSTEGMERNATVFSNGEMYPFGLWFDKKFATFVKTGWIRPGELHEKFYLMRREPHGPIVQRLEPRNRHLRQTDGLFVDECLYKHWQKEKHDAWFKRILSGGFDADTVYVEYGKAEAEVWNEDGVVINSGSA